MTDAVLLVKDATSSTKSLAASDGGLAGLTPYHKEDTAQRADLLAAIALLATHADAQAIATALAGALQVTGPLTAAQLALASLATHADAQAIAAALAGPLQVTGPLTGAQLTSAALATHADAQAIVSAIAAQGAVQAWTDDSGVFFILNVKGGAFTWTDVSGNASAAPGVGARPAGGASLVVARSGFQATAAGTGYSVGDFLDHVVTTDPGTGVVIGHYWLNITTEAKMASAPASANIAPVSAPNLGGATSALQTTGNTKLDTIHADGAALLSALQATLAVRQAGTAGSDYSANKPPIPLVGANFAATGPYANYVLVATLPASPTRSMAFAMNLSGADCLLVLDDGAAIAGAAPANASLLALGGGTASGKQGGSTGPEMASFKGRIQAYAPSAAALITLTGW